MHQNRASPFASDFYRCRGCRREFRSEDHFYPFSSQKKSRFASDFLRRGNRAASGLKKSRDVLGSGIKRRRSRREPRDFGALRLAIIVTCRINIYIYTYIHTHTVYCHDDAHCRPVPFPASLLTFAKPADATQAIADSAATYRGAECPTKQPKNSRKGCRVGHGKTAEKQPRKTAEKQSKQLFFGVSAVFPAVFRLFYRDPLGALFSCFSAVFNVGHLAAL